MDREIDWDSIDLEMERCTEILEEGIGATRFDARVLLKWVREELGALDYTKAASGEYHKRIEDGFDAYIVKLEDILYNKYGIHLDYGDLDKDSAYKLLIDTVNIFTYYGKYFLRKIIKDLLEYNATEELCWIDELDFLPDGKIDKRNALYMFAKLIEFNVHSQMHNILILTDKHVYEYANRLFLDKDVYSIMLEDQVDEYNVVERPTYISQILIEEMVKIYTDRKNN